MTGTESWKEKHNARKQNRTLIKKKKKFPFKEEKHKFRWFYRILIKQPDSVAEVGGRAHHTHLEEPQGMEKAG